MPYNNEETAKKQYKPAYRLYCQACSGNARYANEVPSRETGEVICQSCQKRTPSGKQHWLANNQ